MPAHPRVDVLWMDVQGPELLVLRGMGVLLSSVRIIHTEVGSRRCTRGGRCFRTSTRFSARPDSCSAPPCTATTGSGNLVCVRSDIVRRSFPAWITSRLRVG
ncbi:MAG: FkbM family methyltransferase [Ignavibacteria bacterium]|nr:FkbM family methyltransferase [Ignavibacteria bacterium]